MLVLMMVLVLALVVLVAVLVAPLLADARVLFSPHPCAPSGSFYA